MTQSLVTTKLRAPRPRPNLVARPRLSEVLSDDEGRVLTLVSAPAGFGKSTLLAEWAQGWSARGGSVAWVSLDGSDGDPARFLDYLVGALRSLWTDFGEGILASLGQPALPPVEALATALVNELAELPQRIVLILDDYHEIGASPVHELVAFVLEHLPENARVIVSTRADPPLPLARLRTRGQMVELRAADLRFTRDEAATFLNDAMGLELSAVDVGALEGVTEGWVAALQLAALSMRHREDASGFVEAFSGSNRHVLDFLAEEVLDRQPADVRRFLLDTAVLGRMTAPLCEALTGRDDGQVMLERLERENLFVVALDDERVWYRYHHLFGDFLRGRLRREDPERAAALHLAAASWHEDHELVDDAIHHALAAEDTGWAARLIERYVTGVFARNERSMLERWLVALPAPAIRSRPRLCLALAYRAMIGGRLTELERLLDDAERAQTAGDPDGREVTPVETGWAASFLEDVPGTVAVLRAALARLRGDVRRSEEFARLARARVGEGHFVSVLADWELARARWMQGDLGAAERALRGQLAEATAALRAAEQPYRVLVVSWDLGRVRYARGDLRSALRTFRDALELAAGAGRAAAPVAGIAHVGLAEVLYERDELDAAAEHAAEGVERCASLANRQPLAAGLATLARVRQARGDAAGALEAIEAAEQVGMDPGMTDLFNPVPVQRARLLLAGGDVAAAARWTLERGLAVEDDPSYVREREHLVLARVLLAEGRLDPALRLLQSMSDAAEAADRTASRIEILALLALVLRAGGEKRRAVETVSRALFLGEPEGYVRSFADEGPQMSALVADVLEAQQRGRPEGTDLVPARYLTRLLAASGQEAARPPSDERLAEPLSERELEVLALVAAGESNREIGQRLWISEATVKSHVNHLFRKLQARNRTQATARARELNLL